MNDIRTDIVEKVLVVRDNEKRLLPGAQVAVQPDDSIQVQVVGWLVQHQQGGLHKECSVGDKYNHMMVAQERHVIIMWEWCVRDHVRVMCNSDVGWCSCNGRHMMLKRDETFLHCNHSMLSTTWTFGTMGWGFKPNTALYNPPTPQIHVELFQLQ